MPPRNPLLSFRRCVLVVGSMLCCRWQKVCFKSVRLTYLQCVGSVLFVEWCCKECVISTDITI
jgi:hypothetical protein